jgi:moderate conductance mechanosensitive channel
LAPEPAPRLQRHLAHNWLAVAVPLFIILAAAQVYGAIGQPFEVSAALVLTLNLIIALLLFETLLNFLHRRLAPADARARRTLLRTLTNCARMAAMIVVIIVLARTWAVDIFGVQDARA